MTFLGLEQIFTKKIESQFHVVSVPWVDSVHSQTSEDGLKLVLHLLDKHASSFSTTSPKNQTYELRVVKVEAVRVEKDHHARAIFVTAPEGKKICPINDQILKWTIDAYINHMAQIGLGFASQLLDPENSVISKNKICTIPLSQTNPFSVIPRSMIANMEY